MTRHRTRHAASAAAACAGAAFAALLAATPVHAQNVGVRLLQAWTTESDVDIPRGAEVLVRFADARLELRAGWVRKDGDGMGHSCTGLAPPDECPYESLHVVGSLASVAAGWRLGLFTFDRDRAAVALVPQLGLARMAGRRTGRLTRRTLDSSTTFATAGVGLGVHVGGRGPFGLDLGVRLEFGTPLGADLCADCYRPYHETLTTATFQAGVTYAFR